jgi:uncharacterized protein (TIGR00297 family)
MLIMQLATGFILGGLIALLAWGARALSTSGALAAALTGGLIFGLGGWSWAVLLMTFFVSSSLLSRLFRKRKIALDEKFSKGSRRDWGQVLANGGLGALLALPLALGYQQPWLWAAFAGAMAAVNADTWATELGVLSSIPPRLITSGKFVERGTSGGVTPLGYAAVLAASALIGAAAMLFTPGELRLGQFLVILASGLAGSTVDSLLGATIQAMYHCPACHKITERHPLHSCGAVTSLERGWTWLNNDAVNFACSLAGALVGAVLWVLFF